MQNFDVLGVAEQIMEAIKKEFKDLNTLNVMILGKTGVGKSTLINNMFNEKLAETGIGKPVTTEIRKISKAGFPLAIYDTPGLELLGENAVSSLLDGVVKEIENGVKSGEISQAIHCIWYCVSATSHRFEEAEIDFLKRLNERTADLEVPVIIVLTQAYSKSDAKKLKSEIEKENLPIVSVVPVLAENFVIDEEYTAKAYGLDKLSDIMNDVIPEAVKKTFIAVQKANLKLKRSRAHAIVIAAASTAAITGAVPIPFADATLLVPEQISMLAGITAAFGITMEKGTIATIISATIGTTGATVLGRTIATNLIKLIPGAGSVVGGAISSATAAALTAALGEAYIVIMTMICQGEMSAKDLNTSKGKETITRVFTELLKIKRNNKGMQIKDTFGEEQETK